MTALGWLESEWRTTLLASNSILRVRGTTNGSTSLGRRGFLCSHREALLRWQRALMRAEPNVAGWRTTEELRRLY